MTLPKEGICYLAPAGELVLVQQLPVAVSHLETVSEEAGHTLGTME